MKRDPVIWRLEGRNGVGPYNQPWSEIKPFGPFPMSHTHQSTHPDPEHDRTEDGRTLVDAAMAAGHARPAGAKFGFSSVEQARRWFERPLVESLEEHGMSLVAYPRDADEAFDGRKQTLFWSHSAPLLKLPAMALCDLSAAELTAKAEEASHAS